MESQAPEEDEGIELSFAAWPALAAFLLSRRSNEWVFRGQADSEWPLSTRLARVLDGAPDDALLVDWENSSIDFFKRQARSRLKSPPDEADLVGWLATMQHYGAPTRLLDWTVSPFVAAYFAFERPQPPEANSAAIWALNVYFCAREHCGSLMPTPFDHLGVRGQSQDVDGVTQTTIPSLDRGEVERLNDRVRWAITNRASWPLPIVPVSQDERMIAQQTVLTCIGDIEQPVDHLAVRGNWINVPRMPGDPITGTDSTIWPLENPRQVLLKIPLPYEWRQEALDSLRLMGITAASLFPGIDGIGRAAVLHLESGPTSVVDVLGGMYGF